MYSDSYNPYLPDWENPQVTGVNKLPRAQHSCPIPTGSPQCGELITILHGFGC